MASAIVPCRMAGVIGLCRMAGVTVLHMFGGAFPDQGRLDRGTT